MMTNISSAAVQSTGANIQCTNVFPVKENMERCFLQERPTATGGI
jgi:hypothetical protein